eukprot:TRINITY_DN7113_c0_g1_i2.p1 TRINITY_DN7113_c0_g1~~TRINITY_DN7113_c0_g1_i2.p1  ORF type:complete len:358 (+),score=41.93 TRINITY_DN7113_c0_g1_i2:161-1234(+)
MKFVLQSFMRFRHVVLPVLALTFVVGSFALLASSARCSVFVELKPTPISGPQLTAFVVNDIEFVFRMAPPPAPALHPEAVLVAATPPALPSTHRVDQGAANIDSTTGRVAAVSSTVPIDALPREPAFLWETREDAESKTEDHFVVKYRHVEVTQKERLEIVLRLLDVLVDTLDRNNIDYWLTNGALLGSYRGSNLIEWDTDGDVGLTFSGFVDLVTVVTHPEFRWAQPDCIMIFRAGKHAHVIPFKLVNTTSGVYVDSMMFFSAEVAAFRGTQTIPGQPQPAAGPEVDKSPGLVCYWPYSCTVCTGQFFPIKLEVVYPLRNNCTLADRQYKCPNDTRTYLWSWYGISFMTPKKTEEI